MTAVRTSWIALMGFALALSPAAAAPPTGLKGAGADADKWLLDNADFVVVLNVKQLVGSEAVKGAGAEAVKGAISAEPRVAAVFEAAGINPLADIDSVLFSGSLGAKSETKGVVVVKGRFDADKALEAAKKKADKVTVLSEDGVDVMQMKVQGHDAFAAFAGKDALVITHSKATTAAWAKSGGKTEAKMSVAMKSALNGFKGGETLTFAMVMNEELRKKITAVPQLAVAGTKLQTITASLSVTDQADFALVASTSDAKAARQVQVALNTLKSLAVVLVSEEEFGPKVTEVLSEMRIGLDGGDVRLSLKVDKALLEKAGKKKTN